MLTKLAGWIIGREPVATATGLAALVSAALGVAAAFGLNITPEQIAAVTALAAALAGYLSRRAVTPVLNPRQPPEAGGIPLAALLLVAVVVLVLAGVFASCDALFEDEDEPNDLGITVTEQAYHEQCDPERGGGCYEGEYDQSYDSYDRNRNRDRNRGAFSPGPFDRSPIDFSGSCFSLDCSGHDGRDREDDQGR